MATTHMLYAQVEPAVMTVQDVEGPTLRLVDLVRTRYVFPDVAEKKRATVIGEVTGGGAHPGDDHVLNADLCVFIPHGRAINPISGTNWEGVGVKPDIEVPADEAFDVAYRMACNL